MTGDMDADGRRHDAQRGKVSGNFHDKDDRGRATRIGGEKGRQQSAFRRVNCDGCDAMDAAAVFAPLTISGVTNAHMAGKKEKIHRPPAPPGPTNHRRIIEGTQLNLTNHYFKLPNCTS